MLLPWLPPWLAAYRGKRQDGVLLRALREPERGNRTVGEDPVPLWLKPLIKGNSGPVKQEYGINPNTRVADFWQLIETEDPGTKITLPAASLNLRFGGVWTRPSNQKSNHAEPLVRPYFPIAVDFLISVCI
jgi:hypothetical protein